MTAHRVLSRKCALACLPSGKYHAAHRQCVDAKCGCFCHSSSATASEGAGFREERRGGSQSPPQGSRAAGGSTTGHPHSSSATAFSAVQAVGDVIGADGSSPTATDPSSRSPVGP